MSIKSQEGASGLFAAEVREKEEGDALKGQGDYGSASHACTTLN